MGMGRVLENSAVELRASGKVAFEGCIEGVAMHRSHRFCDGGCGFLGGVGGELGLGCD